MSHVKRIMKTDKQEVRVLLCTKWAYEHDMTEELKAKISHHALAKDAINKPTKKKPKPGQAQAQEPEQE